jgi:hypothetical protein
VLKIQISASLHAYDMARGRNYEEIADIIRRRPDAASPLHTPQQIDTMAENEIDDKIARVSQRLAAIRTELKILRGGEGRDADAYASKWPNQLRLLDPLLDLTGMSARTRCGI